MVKKIHLIDVLRMIGASVEGQTVRPFSISFALYDRKTKQAGRKMTIKRASKYADKNF